MPDGICKIVREERKKKKAQIGLSKTVISVLRDAQEDKESLSLSLSLFRALNIPAAADTYRYKAKRDPGR